MIRLSNVTPWLTKASVLKAEQGLLHNQGSLLLASLAESPVEAKKY